MATTTQPHLEFTDSVTSIKFMDAAATTPALISAMNFSLTYGDWAPKIATRNKTVFGLPYNPVMEEMTINIKGATTAIVLSKLQTLNALLDQAERWYNNERVAPVLIKYQPKGSEKTAPLSDVVIGRGVGNQSDNAMITLPDDFNSVGNFNFLQRVKVVFWRRNGFWLGEKETQDTGTSYVAQPGPITVTWSDFAPVLSPVEISLGAGADAAGASTNTTTKGITAITNDSRYLVNILGTDATVGGTPTADAAKFPTGANIMRFVTTPTSGGGGYVTTSFPMNECEYFAVFCKVRNGSTTINATIQAQTQLLTQRLVALPASLTAQTLVVFLGIFPTNGKILPSWTVPSTYDFAIVTRAESGSINIDVDSLLFVGVDRATNIIETSGLTHPLLTSTVGISFSNRLLGETQGALTEDTFTTSTLQPYVGSIYNFTGSSLIVKKTALAHFQISSQFWNIINSGGTAKITLDLSVSRQKAYLVPE